MNVTHIVGQIACLDGALAVAAGSLAQPVDTRPMREWILPALTTNAPQTAQEAKEGQRSGRKLPPPEVLQPVLDPALPAFLPRQEKPTGSFKRAASDVLNVLVEKWFERFKTDHPQTT